MIIIRFRAPIILILNQYFDHAKHSYPTRHVYEDAQCLVGEGSPRKFLAVS